MTVLIAPDKFKGSLNAQKVSDSIERGIKQAYKNANTIKLPIADGGDGTLSILKNYINANEVHLESIDALGRSIEAYYLLHQKVAFIELAIASGLAHLKMEDRNPLHTHNRGTGKLMRDALQKGAEKIVLCLGGSATTEAGLSIATELGYRFFDEEKQPLTITGKILSKITHFEKTDAYVDFELDILCDVTNPLYGSNGAAYVYGPQKGADEATVKLLDNGLQHIAGLIKHQMNIDVNSIAGAGAAGGIAGGLLALFNAQLINGFDYLAKLSNLETQIQISDVVVTGEGMVDASSLQGKVLGKIALLCKKYKKPLVVIAGNSNLTTTGLHNSHVKTIYTVKAVAKNENDAMNNAAEYLEKIAAQINWDN